MKLLIILALLVPSFYNEPLIYIRQEDPKIDGVVSAYTPREEETEVIQADITAYTDIETCGDCIMANGEKAHHGAIACPREIPLYTKVKIDNIIYYCKDRTHKKYNGRFDIFFGYGKNAYKLALNFGKQKKEIIIYGD